MNQMLMLSPSFTHLALDSVALHCISASAGSKTNLYRGIHSDRIMRNEAVQYRNLSSRDGSGAGIRPIKQGSNQPPTLQSHRTREPPLSN